jgi:hypothetical protein
MKLKSAIHKIGGSIEAGTLLGAGGSTLVLIPVSVASGILGAPATAPILLTAFGAGTAAAASTLPALLRGRPSKTWIKLFESKKLRGVV